MMNILELESKPLAELRLSPERMARVRLLITKQSKLELERLILANEYISKNEESRRDVGKILACKAALLGLARRLPDLLVGKTVEEMRPIILTDVERILSAFAGKHKDERTGTDD